jgi:hypothetical protein
MTLWCPCSHISNSSVRQAQTMAASRYCIASTSLLVGELETADFKLGQIPDYPNHRPASPARAVV